MVVTTISSQTVVTVSVIMADPSSEKVYPPLPAGESQVPSYPPPQEKSPLVEGYPPQQGQPPPYTGQVPQVHHKMIKGLIGGREMHSGSEKKGGAEERMWEREDGRTNGERGEGSQPERG